MLNSDTVMHSAVALGPSRTDEDQSPAKSEGLLLRKKQESPEKFPLQETSRPLLKAYEPFLITALVLFLLGNTLAAALPDLLFARLPVGLSLIVMLLGLIVSVAATHAKPWVIRASLWAILLIAGALWYPQTHFRPAANDIGRLAPLAHAKVSGTVESIENTGRFVLRLSRVNNHPIQGQALVYWPRAMQAEPPLAAGMRVDLIGDLRQPYDSSVLGAFNQARYLESREITALLKSPNHLKAIALSNQPQYVVQRAADRLQARIAEAFRQHLPSPQSELLGGLVLGDKAVPVNRETRLAFIHTGLVHVLAASGMNVGIIAATVLGLLTMLRCPYRPKLGLALLAVCFYSLLTGLPPSIQRAACMLGLALVLKMLNRQLSPVFLLCITATLLVLLHPDHVRSIGFQFSVLTTFGLLTMMPVLQDKLGFYITRWLAGLLLVPLVAQLWIWPLSVYYFNEFPLHSVPLNMLAMMLVTPATIIGFVAGVLGLFSTTLAGWLAMAAQPFLTLLLWLVRWGDSLAWAQQSLASPPGWLLAMLYVQLFVLMGLCLAWKELSWKRKTLAALLPLLVILSGLCMEKASARQRTTVDLLPLSWRHEALLISPRGSSGGYLALLPASMDYWAGRSFSDFLRHRQITNLRAVVLLPDVPYSASDASFTAKESSSSGLKVALGKVHVAHLLTQEAVDVEKLGLHSQAVQQFPSLESVGGNAGSGRLQMGTLRLEGPLSALRVMDGAACLLSANTQYRPEADCALQLVQEGDAPRLYADSSAKTNQPVLDAAHYYRLESRNNQLRIYSE